VNDEGVSPVSETNNLERLVMPCPFCGGTDVGVYEGETFRWRYARCENCGAQSPDVRVQTMGEGTKEQWEAVGVIDAMKEWNKRA